MREQIEERLATLRQEYETGRRVLADLEARQRELQETLLRIGGAAQVLEELLAAAGEQAGGGVEGGVGSGTEGLRDAEALANGRPAVAGVG